MDDGKKPLTYIQAELVKEKRENINRLVQAVQGAQGEYALVQDMVAEELNIPDTERPLWQFSNDGKFLEKRIEQKPSDKRPKGTFPRGETR